jgi:hypothetical protein
MIKAEIELELELELEVRVWLIVAMVTIIRVG